MTKDEALAKVKKLLKMANDSRGNMNEAENAARQAEALMRKFHLESADVELAELEGEQPQEELVSGARPGKKDAKEVPRWVSVIALSVARLHDCRVTITQKLTGEWVLKFVGFGPDVPVAAWTITALKDAVYNESQRVTKGQGAAAANSFRAGASAALQQRLFQLKKERDQAYAQAPSGSTALMVVDRKLARLEEMFGEQGVRKGKVRKAADANFIKGQIYGQSMNLPSNPLPGQKTSAGHLS